MTKHRQELQVPPAPIAGFGSALGTSARCGALSTKSGVVASPFKMANLQKTDTALRYAVAPVALLNLGYCGSSLRLR
jgi:hypothetical protein